MGEEQQWRGMWKSGKRLFKRHFLKINQENVKVHFDGEVWSFHPVIEWCQVPSWCISANFFNSQDPGIRRQCSRRSKVGVQYVHLLWICFVFFTNTSWHQEFKQYLQSRGVISFEIETDRYWYQEIVSPCVEVPIDKKSCNCARAT